MVKKQLMTARPSESSTENRGVISFDCHAVIAGIAFHLVDEGIALNLEPGSITRTLDRLRRNEVAPSIGRSEWATMTNEQRLQWLLVESKTCAVLSGGVASLSPLRTEVVIAT